MTGSTGSSRLDMLPPPAKVENPPVARETAAAEAPETKAEISVQDRGDAIVSRASTALNGFLTSMQTRMNTFATKARKALGFGVGAAVIGAEGAAKTGLVAAEIVGRGGVGMIGEAIDTAIVQPAAAVYDAVRPRKAFDADAMTAVEMKIIQTTEAIRNGNAATKEAMIAHLAELEAEKAAIQNTQRELIGSDTVRAAGGAIRTGAETAGGLAVAGVVGTGMAAAKGAGWVAGKAGEAALGVAQATVDHVLDPLYETAVEKKKDYLEAGTAVEKALSKISGKDVKLSEKQMLALGASMDTAGILGSAVAKVGEVAYQAMLMEDAEDIIRNLGKGGVMLKDYVTDPNVPQQIWDSMKKFNTDAGKAIGDAAGDVADALIVKPAQAVGRGAAVVGRGAATAANTVAGGVAMGAMGAAALGAAGVGAAYEGGKFAAGKAVENLDALGNAGVALEGRVRQRASAAVNTPEMIALRRNFAEAPDAMHREIKKVDQELVKLTAQGASLFERMRSNVSEFMTAINDAFNKLRMPKITEAMAEDHPDLAEGIPGAVDLLAKVDAAAAEDATTAPRPKIVPVKRAVKSGK